jgi:hypothetical protein
MTSVRHLQRKRDWAAGNGAGGPAPQKGVEISHDGAIKRVEKGKR